MQRCGNPEALWRSGSAPHVAELPCPGFYRVLWHYGRECMEIHFSHVSYNVQM